MKRTLLLITAAVFALIGCGAQNKDDNASSAKPKVPLDVRMNYSHEVHKKVMQKEGFDCFVCHPMDVKPKDEKSVEEAIKLSKQSFFPGKDTCHFCHYNPEAGNIAPGECSLCHFNMAEIELSVLSRQCLSRRIASLEALTHEVAAWQQRRNAARATVKWRFTTDDARIKLKSLYPQVDP